MYICIYLYSFLALKRWKMKTVQKHNEVKQALRGRKMAHRGKARLDVLGIVQCEIYHSTRLKDINIIY